MALIIIFLILSVTSYLVIERNVKNLTKTPIWLLWLVLMSPALIWTGWHTIYPEEKSIPSILILLPLIISPLFYLWLIEIGKPAKAVQPSSKKNIISSSESE